MALGSFFGADFAGDFEIDTLQMTLSDGGVVLNVDKDFIEVICDPTIPLKKTVIILAVNPKT